MKAQNGKIYFILKEIITAILHSFMEVVKPIIWNKFLELLLNTKMINRPSMREDSMFLSFIRWEQKNNSRMIWGFFLQNSS